MTKKLAILTLFFCFALTALLAQKSSYEDLKASAEKYFAEGSYKRAHELYTQAAALKLSPSQKRWVDFRLADTRWRSQAATETADPTEYENAQSQLQALLAETKRVEDRDQLWAEIQESLGDFHWMRRDSKDWGSAWTNYQQALDWWAGSEAIDTARTRYLRIVWKMSAPAYAPDYYYFGYYGNSIPIDVLENALKIAQNKEDQTRMHYLMAMSLRNQGVENLERIPEEFEEALKAGRKSDWYDDALFHYAEWMMNSGRFMENEDGFWRQEPDFPKALELYRRLRREFAKGETRYFDDAGQRIENITMPVVGVAVSNIFLPDSELQFHLNWRNVKTIQLAIYKMNLTRDVYFKDPNEYSGKWLQQVDMTKVEQIRAWRNETKDRGDYKPGQETVRLDQKLPPGAYLLQAKSGAVEARDLILITDGSLVVKTSGKKLLAYFCSVQNGAPIPGANVKMWQRVYSGNNYVWNQSSQTTNRDGVSIFELPDIPSSSDFFVAAAQEDRQAFSLANSYSANSGIPTWRIYAFTDKPAYRPEETVQWKFIARKNDGTQYSTPSNQGVEFEITDPRGTKVKEDKIRLNEFGSSWGSLELSESMPLGEYRITFWDSGRSNQIGNAVLFRLEEYKLPEFKVSVTTPKEDGKKKAFRVGEKVEVDIAAEYYFGGPVANADVKVLVYQNPFYHWYAPVRDYPWLYQENDQRRYWYGNGQVIKTVELKTDAAGKARVSFDTPRNTGQDFEYRIEARVTDSSRREILSSESVRVTRQTYYVYPRAEHNLYRPQDRVKTEITSLDANNQPVSVEGTVEVTRDRWYQVWIDPNGKEIQGEELRLLRQKMPAFPPISDTPHKWRLKFQGYEHEKIFTRSVKTDEKGKAELEFTPEKEGYYRIVWTSKDRVGTKPNVPRLPIQAETSVWVATNATADLGYHHGGLEIIVDRDTFRAGQTAPLMLHTPINDRYVLFTVEGLELYEYRLVHLTGTVKLLELPITEKLVPNIFLSAVMISDREIFMDTKEAVVPPIEHFLEVELKTDREQYQPREEGTLTIRTRDHYGKPVAAEVAIGMIDESVYYIQQDYAMDPRQFYYGEKRRLAVGTQSTFQQKQYSKLIQGDREELVDEKNERRKDLAGGKTEDLDKMRSLGYVAGSMAAERSLAQSPAAPMALKEAKVAQDAQPLEQAVQVRADFRSSILWRPDLITSRDGTATVKVRFPDSLTGWKATARVASAGNQFGIASAITHTEQPLIVRLQAPRFFVAGDTVTVSAIVNNHTEEAITTAPSLIAEGVELTTKNEAAAQVIPARGESRVDWIVSVRKPGLAKLKVTARSEKYSDAMEKTYPIYEHGIEKLISKSGKVRGSGVTVKLEIPELRKIDSTTLTVQVTPSLAVTMLDALPYLIDYPYGCTEQTISRFLPAVITAKTLQDLHLGKAPAGKSYGGIVEEYLSKTHPKGKKDVRKLDDMIKAGLDRLYQFQHSDGGWGWWKDGDTDHFMTGYVVWGLTLAETADVRIRPEVLQRGVDYLQKEIVEEELNYDRQAWMLHALAAFHAQKKTERSAFESKAFENLWKNRDRLNAYTRALLCLSAHYYGFRDRAEVLVRNLENGVKVDKAPDASLLITGSTSVESVMPTAHWGEDGIYWRWSDGGVEATAFVLRALLAVDPQNRLVEPASNWLIKNRRGSQWSNTRDTAIAVLTFNDYLRVSGELASDFAYDLTINGSSVASGNVRPENILSAPAQFKIDQNLIRNGLNEISIRRKAGKGPIYFAVYANFFSMEEPITPTGNEIFVKRQYHNLQEKPTLLRGYTYEKHPVSDNSNVTSGNRVEVVLSVESKNHYEYLIFEDLKPAGLEAVQIRSGEPLYARELKAGAPSDPQKRSETDYTGRTRWIYQELRDRKIAMFIDQLPQGMWEIHYDLRAEVPGNFHALPLMAHAMYVPEIRANDTEIRIQVEDQAR